MTDETPLDEGLSPEEQQLLSRTGRDREPPAELLDRIMRDLRSRGLLAPAREASLRPTVLRLLAAAAVFVLGLWIGWAARTPEPASATSEPRFMLLLYSDSGFREGTAADARQRVREYGDWARALARDGRLVAGDELAGDGRQVTSSGASDAAPRRQDEPRGYFVIVARDEASALQIAATCPHLRHGGRVVLRRIVT